MTEIVVIVALMGAGLKLDRPFGWTRWRPIRRLGSFYYLAFATGSAEFGTEEPLGATVLVIILVSIVFHGITVRPIMLRLAKPERGLLQAPK